MAEPRFLLKCLGYPELRGPDGKVIRIRVKKHIALLVYLAVERRRHHDRDRLVALFWPKVSPEKGRHSVAVAVSLLRAIFGRGAFPPHRVGLRFAPTLLDLDLERLEAGRIVGAGGDDDLDVDGFLQGFDIDDALEFGLWKEREHARRLPAIHAGLLTLIDHGRRRGSHDEIMRRAERLLTLDHLAEEGIRAKMEALALVGDRFSAIRVFEEWKIELGKELNAEPSMLVEGMAAQLRKRGWEPKEPNPVPAVPAEQWRDRRFVGRKAEFRQLYEVWESVHQYRPQHFMIAGDSGVGKTTLAQRLVTAAGLEGASVSRVQCYQMEQRIPFGTIGALVAGLLGRPGVAATSPEGLAEIARIVPQVRQHFPALPAPKQAEGETARLLFAEGVIDLLRAVMEERPVLLVIDDLHHADEASLAVLHLVMRRIGEGRLLVVSSTMPSTTPRASPLVTQSPGSPVVATEVELSPMSRGEAREMAEAILSERNVRPALPVLLALCDASAGFPLALELIVADWLERGAASVAIALRSVSSRTATPVSPSRYSLLIERLLNSLSARAHRVISLAALLGSRLGKVEWYTSIDLTVAQTFVGLAELVKLRLVRDTGTGLEFANDLVRAQVYNRIPVSVREALHNSIAGRLLADTAHQLGGIEVAWHLARAGRPAEAVPHLLRGAEESRRRGAPDEAILALESALPQMDAISSAHARLLVAALYQEIGRWQESVEALEGVDAASNWIKVERHALEIWGRWNLQTRDHSDAQSICEMVGIAKSGQSCSALALMLASRMALEMQSTDGARQVLAAAPSVQASSVDEALWKRVALGTTLFQLGRREESAVQAEMALASVGPDRADGVVARLYNGLGAVRAVGGDYGLATEAFAKALAIAERLENDNLIAQILSNQAFALLRLRRYNEAACSAEKALSRLGRHGAPGYALRCIEVCGLSQGMMGNTDGALAWTRQGDSTAANCCVELARREWSLAKADILWVMGRRRAALGAADTQLDGEEDHHWMGQHIRWRARVAIARGTGRSFLMGLDLTREADALDGVEILAAAAELERSHAGIVTSGTARRLANATLKLQPVTVLHLQDMDVLQKVL